jgi:hypothetical protein
MNSRYEMQARAERRRYLEDATVHTVRRLDCAVRRFFHAVFAVGQPCR